METMIRQPRTADDSGVRRGDAFSARWRGGELIRLVQQKTGKRIVRRIRAATIAACLAVRRDDDDRLIPLRYGMTKWRKDFAKLCKAAGVDVPEAGLQMLRRSGASYTKKNGGDPRAYLGHSMKSGNLADEFYLDHEICDEPPPLPPPIE